MIRRYPAVVGTLVFVSAIAGCGSGSGSGTTAPSSSPGTNATSDPSSPPRGTASGVAAVMPTLADLPAGWTQHPHHHSKQDDVINRAYDKCLGIPFINTYRTAAYYAEFQSGDKLDGVDAEVDMVKQGAEAQRDFRAVAAARGKHCVLASLQTVAAAYKPGHAEVPGVSRRPSPAHVWGYRAVEKLTTSKGNTLPLYFDNYGWSAGRAEIQVVFTAGLHAPDDHLEAKILAGMLARTKQQNLS